MHAVARIVTPVHAVLRSGACDAGAIKHSLQEGGACRPWTETDRAAMRETARWRHRERNWQQKKL